MASRMAILGLAIGCAPGAAGAAGAQPGPALHPTRWRRVPVGSIKPKGWLEKQARLQAGALTSHLPIFWPNVAATSWLGGPADVDGGLHESTPYWLNGATPLAVQLEDQTLLEVVDRYIDEILQRQAADGWLGPDTDHADFWSRFPFVLALVQRHESLPDADARRAGLADACVRFFDSVAARLAWGLKLESWSSVRAHDLIWAIHYVVDVLAAEPQPEPDKIARLLALAALLHKDGFDWRDGWYRSANFPRGSVSQDMNMQTHGVNNAQAFKFGAVWARQTGDFRAGVNDSLQAWGMLMQYHGMPTGIFGCDEHLAGRMPSRGTELCTVVEAMWSLALVAQAAPHDSQSTAALDALEKLAFNALPGSLSDDLWSHPYLQFPNSFEAVHVDDHVWAADGPDAAMYGLAPNYECCTANFHQGYPKLIAHLFFTLPADNALVSAIWAPSAVNATDVGGGVEAELRTDYPFGLSADYLIRNAEAFQLRIRLPAFLREVPVPGQGLASVRLWVDGQRQIVHLKGGFLEYTIPAWPQPTPRVAVHIEWDVVPQVKPSDDPQQGASVFVGPLLMALDLAEQRQRVKSYQFEAADWNITAGRPWQYGLRTSGAAPPSRPVMREIGAQPFKHGPVGCPLIMNATLVRIAQGAWTAEHNAPGPLPAVGQGASEEDVLLLPYACSAIRISSFPVADGLFTA